VRPEGVADGHLVDIPDPGYEPGEDVSQYLIPHRWLLRARSKTQFLLRELFKGSGPGKGALRSKRTQIAWGLEKSRSINRIFDRTVNRHR
jgi:hypothetical protein